ncbi:MAG: hypothetical protein NC913_09375, partial [Candidatus Omnitrophica bacterium]|nr:hypothetical protein [Candidatus Omnitrophota bacterium]
MGDGIRLRLTNPEAGSGARICVVSLPLRKRDQCLKKMKGIKTQAVVVGYWPETGKVRRQLMFGMGEEIPEEVEVVEGEDTGQYCGPEAGIKVIKEKKTGIVLMEEDELEVRYHDKRVGIRIGLIHKGQIHWWEWVKIQQLWSGPVCQGIIAGGFIEVERTTDEEIAQAREKNRVYGIYTHNHNWLRGEAYIWLFSNGLIKLTIRHINNHLFDHGKDLEDV